MGIVEGLAKVRANRGIASRRVQRVNPPNHFHFLHHQNQSQSHTASEYNFFRTRNNKTSSFSTIATTEAHGHNSYTTIPELAPTQHHLTTTTTPPQLATMLAIQPFNPQKTTPNLLPTRIHHNGPINSVSRYWTPSTDEKGTQHIHFRGRHLHGTSIPLPSNYTGAVLHVTEEIAPQSKQQPAKPEQDEDGEEEDDVDMGEEVEVKLAKQIGSFDEIVVWEHGGTVDGERDGFVRGLGEWVEWAGRMHGEDEEDESSTEESTTGGKQA
jgi:ribonuclease H2 subunit C